MCDVQYWRPDYTLKYITTACFILTLQPEWPDAYILMHDYHTQWKIQCFCEDLGFWEWVVLLQCFRMVWHLPWSLLLLIFSGLNISTADKSYLDFYFCWRSFIWNGSNPGKKTNRYFGVLFAFQVFLTGFWQYFVQWTRKTLHIRASCPMFK